MGGWPSGQRQQTVNLPTYVYGGSNPPPPTNSTRQADLAQQVEHIHGKDGVSGSSPEVGSMFIKRSGTLHAPDRVSFGLYEAVIQSTSAT